MARGILTKTWDASGNILTIKVGDAGTTTLDIRNLAEATRMDALRFGLQESCGNAAAMECDETTGKPASAADKFRRVRARMDQLNSGGPWRRTERAPVVRLNPAISAAAEKAGITYEEAEARMVALFEAQLMGDLAGAKVDTGAGDTQ